MVETAAQQAPSERPELMEADGGSVDARAYCSSQAQENGPHTKMLTLTRAPLVGHVRQQLKEAGRDALTST